MRPARYALGAVLPALALSGCAIAAPEARPTAESSDVDCGSPTSVSTGDASVRWGEPAPAQDASLGFQVQTVGEDGSLTPENRLVPYAPSVEFAATVDGPVVDGEAWQDLLVENYARSDIDPAVVYAPQPDFDDVPFEPEGPGTWVVGYRATQVAVPFAVDCDGEGAPEGSLLVSDGEPLRTELVQCGAPSVAPSEYTAETLAQCPAG